MKLNLDDAMMLLLTLVLVPSGRGREAQLDLATVRGGRGPCPLSCKNKLSQYTQQETRGIRKCNACK